MFDSVLILKGDIRCWSLLGAIGLMEFIIRVKS